MEPNCELEPKSRLIVWRVTETHRSHWRGGLGVRRTRRTRRRWARATGSSADAAGVWRATWRAGTRRCSARTQTREEAAPAWMMRVQLARPQAYSFERRRRATEMSTTPLQRSHFYWPKSATQRLQRSLFLSRASASASGDYSECDCIITLETIKYCLVFIIFDRINEHETIEYQGRN